MIDLTSIVIIEGPDAAGKTTLARAMANRRYLHQGPYQHDPLEESLQLLLPMAGERLVLDRFHVGEQVYGPIFRGQDALGGAGRRMLERYLLSRRTVLVRAMPPFQAAHDVWASRQAHGKEMFTTRFSEIYHRFIYAVSQLPTVLYDYTEDSVDEAIIRVIAELKKLRANRGPGVGNFATGVTLVVGEQCSKAYRETAMPFIGRGGCSEWLAERLEEAGVDEKTLYWVNAKQNDGSTTPFEFIFDLQPRRVVLLGNVAAAWYADRAIPASITGADMFEHPQHHKRFKHHEPYALIEALKGE